MSENVSQKYAIVEHGGRQLRVEEGDVIVLDHVEGEVGAKVELGRPLLVQAGGSLKIGQPAVDGAKVTATILGHEKAAKILIFKFRKVKNYRRKRGHRQAVTRLKIESISA